MMRLMPKEAQVDPEEEQRKATRAVQESFVLFAVSVAIIRAAPFVLGQFS